MSVLPLEYYQQTDVVSLSRDLLGKFLFTKLDGMLTGGMIIETEAYRAPDDRASHAFGNRRTNRNEVMFHDGGVCYVFLCYGIHSLFNIVTNKAGIPHAILIRALKPEIGIDAMKQRRNTSNKDKLLANGPGTMSQALGITINHNGLPLILPPIWLEDQGVSFSPKEILTTPRIGVDYAKEDALLPWRFRVASCVGI